MQTLESWLEDNAIRYSEKGRLISYTILSEQFPSKDLIVIKDRRKIQEPIYYVKEGFHSQDRRKNPYEYKGD